MSGLDDRLRQAVDRLSGAVPPAQVERVRSRKARLGAVRRLQVAGLVGVVLAATAGGTWRLWQAFHPGSPERAVTKPSRVRVSPSPESPRAVGVIAFSRDAGRSGESTIFTIEADGTNLTKIIGPMYSSRTSWSPDGLSIAFNRGLGEGQGEIVIMDLRQGGKTRILTTYNIPQGPAWSPDGTQIAFFTGFSPVGIHVIGVDGGEPIRLTDPPSHCGDGDPNWSPDGTRIAFNRSCLGKFGSIHVMNADGSGRVQVTEGQGAQWPAWSPDGSLIAFHDVVNRDGIGIWVIAPDGTGLTPLSPSGGIDRYPTWSPDGTMIAFVSEEDGNEEIYVMNADGSGRRNLTNDPVDDTHPAWNPLLTATVSPTDSG